MIDKLYDKISKISFSIYGDDFLKYFGEYKTIIRELGTEVDSLHGAHRRLDRLVLVDDDTLQNWEFQFKNLGENQLEHFFEYNMLKSAETGKVVDTFVIFFDNPEKCKKSVEIGRSIQFAPIIKSMQKMGLPKRLNIIEKKLLAIRKVV